MNPLSDWLLPDWPAPANVRACVTTRAGGVSHPPFASFNLGDHVGDDPDAVASNRQRLAAALGCSPVWLNQVHSPDVVRAQVNTLACADASFTDVPNQACAVLTADCLPVLFCDRAGTTVAAAHAGWRGLAAGVLENTVAAMQLEPAEILVWLGPCIGPASFEVGNEVREVFVAQHQQAEKAFVPSVNADKWMADLYQLARIRLSEIGVQAFYGGGFDTYTDSRFFSYRKDPRTGRFASLIWRVS